jgi:hypothetical protein
MFIAIVLFTSWVSPPLMRARAYGGTGMKRALLAAAAALVSAGIIAGPAFADEVTIEKKTTKARDIPESGSTVSTVIVAPDPPPPLRAEALPPSPGPDLVWIAGHWSWSPDMQNYVWTPGEYREPPRAHAAWLPGRWMQRHDGWVWDEGRWQ